VRHHPHTPTPSKKKKEKEKEKRRQSRTHARKRPHHAGGRTERLGCLCLSEAGCSGRTTLFLNVFLFPLFSSLFFLLSFPFFPSKDSRLATVPAAPPSKDGKESADAKKSRASKRGHGFIRLSASFDVNTNEVSQFKEKENEKFKDGFLLNLFCFSWWFASRRHASSRAPKQARKSQQQAKKTEELAK
jgi:hypothetical protein